MMTDTVSTESMSTNNSTGGSSISAGAANSSSVSILPSPSIQMARSLNNLGNEGNENGIDNLTAYNLFQMQMDSGSLEAAVDAMKRLHVVCIMEGPDKTSTDILPYLLSQTTTYNDELLLILGQELSKVAEYLNTSKDGKNDVLLLLEKLANVEETVVRDQAVAVLVQMCAPDTVHTIHNIVKRLVGADWFTAKVSAAGIAPSLLPFLDNANSFELLSLYKELCNDETPMVRRGAAKHLGKCLQYGSWTQRDFASYATTLLKSDEQDSVRLLAVASIAQAGPEFADHPVWTIQHWLPIVKDGSTDMSWRVRNNLAKHFSDVANVLGIQGRNAYQKEQNLVMACFVAMLTDAEAEVRAAAVSHLAKMVAWGGPQLFATHLQPLLPALADDVVMEVRSKCALALMDAAHGGSLEDNTILQAFGPLLESFLQDEFHEVQLQVLSNLHKISHLLPAMPGVVTSLLNMSKNQNWRVRQAVAKLLPHLAEARGLEFFSTVLLEPAWLTLLLDPVASVRNSIVEGMPLLVSATGEDFLLNTLLPHHVKIYNQNSNTYLVRMTILRAHVETAKAQPGPELFQDVLVQILRGLQDAVPNVRMVAAAGLAQIVESNSDNADATSQIRPALEKRIQEEEDVDCKMACQNALDRIK